MKHLTILLTMITINAYSQSGNVGIGNTDPDSKLEITGEGASSSTSALNVTNSSGGSMLFVRDDGRVGLGTESPTEGLDLASGKNFRMSVDGSHYLKLTPSTNNFRFETIGQYIDLRPNHGTYGVLIRNFTGSSNEIWTSLKTVDAGTDYFQISMNTTSSNAGLFVNDNDRVGIGTNNPLASLDVRGNATFNDAGGNFDFRIEGDNSPNLFFVDASTDRVAIGRSNPFYPFEVEANFTEYAARIRNTNTSALNSGGLLVVGGIINASSKSFAVRRSDNTTELFNIQGTGNAWLAGILVQGSDRNLKMNIKKCEYGLSQILLLNPVTYNWKPEVGNTSEVNIGLIAQEVEIIIPEVVRTMEDIKGIDYNMLIPILINSIKEQQSYIKNLETRIIELETSK